MTARAPTEEQTTVGNRLSKIVTRTGDNGTTGLADGARVSKSSIRIAALGEVDELNCSIGVLLAEGLPDDVRGTLELLQQRLFDLGADLCYPSRDSFAAEHVHALDAALESFNGKLPPLEEFILPGGTRAGALCHLARAVTRRCERSIVRLAEIERVNPSALQWVNRLSDLLFVMSRVINRAAGRPEHLWQSPRVSAAKE